MHCVNIIEEKAEASLVTAFRVALNGYNPYRRNCEPYQDSFWQLISGGKKLGLLNDDFKAAHNVTDREIDSWEARHTLPDPKTRGRVQASLKSSLSEIRI